MKVRFIYEYTLPWEDCQMCVIGIRTLREKGQYFEVGIGLLFIALILHFGKVPGE